MTLKMQMLVLLSILVFQAAAGGNKRGYKAWKEEFGAKATMNKHEDIFRSIIYDQNVKAINQHNDNPDKTWEAGENQFTGLTKEQFKLIYLNAILSSALAEVKVEVVEDDDDPAADDQEGGIVANALAAEIDWATAGVVSSVKSQGSCGSCWAFAAVASIESSFMIKNGVELDLSEQQLVSCTSGFGNFGCNGGWADKAMLYVLNAGIATEAIYPYKSGGDGQTRSCYNWPKDYSIKSMRLTRGGVCTALKRALQKRPIATIVGADEWNNYKSGIMSCNTDNDNHIVLLVGYDSKGNWRIKNSWGNWWGENGYMRIVPNMENNCCLCKRVGVAAIV